MIYFEVDVALGFVMRQESDIPSIVDNYDARLFRTDGKIVEASYVLEDGTVEWKQAD